MPISDPERRRKVARELIASKRAEWKRLGLDWRGKPKKEVEDSIDPLDLIALQDPEIRKGRKERYDRGNIHTEKQGDGTNDK